MKTLELILKGYMNGEYTMNEMSSIVNETMIYVGYKSSYGTRKLTAIYNGKRIVATI